MAMNDEAADILREALTGQSGIEEKKMFGGVTFMKDGHMLCGPLEAGAMFRVGKDREAAALEIPGVGPMTFTKRRMGGFVEVGMSELENAGTRSKLMDMALAFVATMPAK